MKILVADDEAVALQVLRNLLGAWGYEIVECVDGTTAWDTLRRDESVSFAILDWQMPGLTGPEVCRKVRQEIRRPLHLIILTGTRFGIDFIVEGFEAGADDFLTEPFEPRELKARLQVGERMVRLQSDLGERVRELEAALEKVKLLQGLLPICAYCRKVRDDKNYWHEVESYVAEHSEVKFSHGICPDCLRKMFPGQAERVLNGPGPSAG